MAVLSPNLCVRCNAAEAPHPLGLCAACAMNTKVELTAGFQRLGEYLTAWAAFERWLDERTD